MRVFVFNPRKNGASLARRFVALAATREAERREARALAGAETAFKAGRGDDGRAALAEADFYRGAAAGCRKFT